MRTDEFLDVNLLFKASEESVFPPHEIQASSSIKESETGSIEPISSLCLKGYKKLET